MPPKIQRSSRGTNNIRRLSNSSALDFHIGPGGRPGPLFHVRYYFPYVPNFRSARQRPSLELVAIGVYYGGAAVRDP